MSAPRRPSPYTRAALGLVPMPSRYPWWERTLEASVDTVATLLLEETKNLRCRDESIVRDGSEEFAVFILKGQWRAMRTLHASEARETTMEEESVGGEDGTDSPAGICRSPR